MGMLHLDASSKVSAVQLCSSGSFQSQLKCMGTSLVGLKFDPVELETKIQHFLMMGLIMLLRTLGGRGLPSRI